MSSGRTEANNNGTDFLYLDTSENIFDIIQYSANTTISFFDIEYDSLGNKYMLGRYYKESIDIVVDGQVLDDESDYVSILTKTDTNGDMIWNKKIMHTQVGSNATGPIISDLEIDEKDNLYLFGDMTNFVGWCKVGVGDFSPINPDILQEANENNFVLSKFNKDGVTLWNTTITGDADTLFLQPTLRYDNKFLFITFNFTGTVIINSTTTYTTGSNQIINSIGCKVDVKTGEILRSKHLKSSKHNCITDLTTDEDNVYIIGEFKGEGIFDEYDLFSNGESGYVMKMKKTGIIVNVFEIYADEKLVLNKINLDSENIYISGSWSGTLYINGKIKNTDHEEFFITNIKKNDI